MIKNDSNFEYIVRLDSEFAQIQDFDLLLERILFEARRVANADAGSIYVKTAVEKDGVIADKLCIKYSQNDTIQGRLPPGQKIIYSVFSVPITKESVAGYCALTKKPINIQDMYDIPQELPFSFNSNFDKIAGYKTTSTLTIPLVANGILLGVIQVINAKDKDKNIVPFSAADELLMTHFANSVSIVLQRAFLTRTMIMRMSKMAELRDPFETGTHVNRVSSYSVEIYDRWAYHKKIPAEEREKFRDALKVSSILHDIGKVAISDTILKKNARLTPEEFSVMQMHTCHGADLFTDTHSPVDMLARDIALTHHENWDGTGYPGVIDPVTMTPLKTASKLTGKKGEEIPLGGRIVAIADVFDALCSKRCYKESWAEEDALLEIRQLAGTKFDPELVEIFFEILPNIKQAQKMYPD